MKNSLQCLAIQVLDTCRSRGLTLATAESCTGGLIAATLTDVPGSSDVFDRGYVTYSNQAKSDMLGIAPDLITQHGAVSELVARHMAQGALANSSCNVAVAVTGIAGPGGGSEHKPVGLVHIAVAESNGNSRHQKCLFGPLSRTEIRQNTVEKALILLDDIISIPVCT